MINKILSLTELSKTVNDLKKNGKVVVQCHGCFDMLHYGHLKHFESAKKLGDILIVTLTQDVYVNKGPDRPIFKESQRADFISALECVDYVSINNWPTAIETINLIRPNIYAKGVEYSNISNDLTGKIKDEKDAIEAVGGKLVFTDDQVYSSSSLINLLQQEENQNLKKIMNYLKERNSEDSILSLFNKLTNKRIMVIGDTILDEYHHVVPIGKSSKAAAISTKFLSSELHPGGILAIANHVSPFVNEVRLFTMMGDDNEYYERFIRENLKENVKLNLFKKKNSPTIRKTRFVDDFKSNNVFEVSYINESKVTHELEDEILNELECCIAEYDVVILADFGHYFLTEKIIRFLEKNSKFLAVNVQTNSLNFGFNTINKIQRADYLSIDEKELRVGMQNNTDNTDKLITTYIQGHPNIKQFSLTLGGKGAVVINKEDKVSIPILTSGIVDTVGAGDAFLSLSSLVASLGAGPEVIGVVGNLAGGMATKYLGNKKTTDRVEYLKALMSLLK